MFVAVERIAGPRIAPLPSTLPAIARRPAAHDFAMKSALAQAINPDEPVRALHAAGWTGRGVGVAIVDSTLLTTHSEFADRLRYYDEIDVEPTDYARWHGTAVASLAAGKTLGVAPEADLYYAALGVHWAHEPFGNLLVELRRATHTGQPLALAIRRLLAVNRTLAPARRIRVLSLSIGAPPTWQGGAEAQRAIQEAQDAGLFVSAIDLQPAPYGPANIASPASDNAIAGFAQPAVSWAIARWAGLYALECERDPSMTPLRFLDAHGTEIRTRLGTLSR